MPGALVSSSTPGCERSPGDYVDLLHVTDNAFVCAAKLIKVEITFGKPNQFVQAFLSIRASPDLCRRHSR
jgi:hypothetical protein